MPRTVPASLSPAAVSSRPPAQVSLTPEQQAAFSALLAALPTAHMRRLVIVLQNYITITLYQQQAITPGVEVATKVSACIALAC